MPRLRFKFFLFILSFAVLASALHADEAAEGPRPVRHAITFEPLVLAFDHSQDIGPLSYHYSVNRFFSLSGLTQLAMRNTKSYFAARWGVGFGLSVWLPSSRPFQGLFLTKIFDMENTWVISHSPSYGSDGGAGFSLAQTTETGYQWSIHDYLIAPRLRFTAFTSIDAVSLSIGRAW